jgi:AAA15 family ATPase/GTPase
MNELGLCEIALAGFEAFDELVRLPLRRLTFLFGPNSAGKSSVEDALKILSGVCCIGEFTDEDWYARSSRFI